MFLKCSLYRHNICIVLWTWDFSPTLYFTHSTVQNVFVWSVATFLPPHTFFLFFFYFTLLRVWCGFETKTVYKCGCVGMWQIPVKQFRLMASSGHKNISPIYCLTAVLSFALLDNRSGERNKKYQCLKCVECSKSFFWREKQFVSADYYLRECLFVYFWDEVDDAEGLKLGDLKPNFVSS